MHTNGDEVQDDAVKCGITNDQHIGGDENVVLRVHTSGSVSACQEVNYLAGVSFYNRD